MRSIYFSLFQHRFCQALLCVSVHFLKQVPFLFIVWENKGCKVVQDVGRLRSRALWKGSPYSPWSSSYLMEVPGLYKMISLNHKWILTWAEFKIRFKNKSLSYEEFCPILPSSMSAKIIRYIRILLPQGSCHLSLVLNTHYFALISSCYYLIQRKYNLWSWHVCFYKYLVSVFMLKFGFSMWWI